MQNLPKSVSDLYSDACEAPTVKEAMAILNKAKDLPQDEKDVFVNNIREFNAAAKKNNIISVKVLNADDMILKVAFKTEKPKP